MAEKRGTRAVIVVGVAAALAGGLIYLITRKAKAAPPTIYTCPYCGAQFATEELLYEHIEAAHPGEPPGVIYTCPYCGAQFLTEEELNEHIEIEHPTPPAAGVEITSITLDKAELVSGEVFVISITFKNNLDADAYVRPQFALGKVSDTTFTPEMVLAGLGYDPETGIYIDPKEVTDWANLGHPNTAGSNMPQFVYDPDGIPVMMPGGGEGECWLKVPAKGQATTSRLWYITSKDFTYGVRDVCVNVPNPFYLVYDPGWGTRTVGTQTVVLNWRPIGLESISTVVPDIVTIGLAPEAVTIDKFELQINFAGYKANTKTTITNNTGKTLICRPSDWIYTKLPIKAYTGEQFTIPPYGLTGARTYKPGDYLFTLLAQKSAGAGSGIGNIPPGTTIISASCGPYAAPWCLSLPSYTGTDHKAARYPLSVVPDGLKCYAVIHFYQVDERPTPYVYGADTYEVFKGLFSSSWQIWTKVPFSGPVEKRTFFGVPYLEFTLLDGSGLILLF